MVLLRLCLPFIFDTSLDLYALMSNHIVKEQVDDEVSPTLIPGEETIHRLPEATEIREKDNQIERTKRASMDMTTVDTKPIIDKKPRHFNSISLWSLIGRIWALGAITILIINIKEAMLFSRKFMFCKHIVDIQIIGMVENHKLSFYGGY